MPVKTEPESKKCGPNQCKMVLKQQCKMTNPIKKKKDNNAK